MERYIDADAFLKKIERYSLSNGTTLGKHSGVADEIIDILMALPTADVVPKSEVEELKHIYKRYNKAIKHERAEVAREIFEEISKASADWGCYCISSTKWGYVTRDVSRTLAELKKKYTEEGGE